MSDLPSPDPDSPPPRTTGGNWRWEPPTPEELEPMLPGYTVEKLLGRGGMGAVYKGMQKSLERPVAIKVLPAGIEKEDASYAERFRNEAKVMARLLHPAVVAVFDFGEARDGQFFFVMEYIDGTDIAEMISAHDRLPAEHALAITAHVCDALTAAHALGIVHRDIKPSNVLINQQGQVKVADFGLAKLDEAGQRGLTQTGMALGTPDYVAPEALVLGVEVDARADLYAVGVMLYQMLTGDLPRGAWKAPSEKVAGLDPRFDEIVNRAMQSDPGDRYPSAAELRNDLDIILTVPMVKTEAPQTAALPQQVVEELPQQRSAAPVKVEARGKRAANVPGQVAKPVKPAPRSSGYKAVFLWGGLGAAVLIVSGIFYALTNKAGSESAPDPALPDSVDVPSSKKEPPAAPKPEGLEATNKVTPVTPKPTMQTFGAYPEGLKVPIPDWLRKASEEGGRLAFHHTVEVPELFDLGEAAQFDDFVEVFTQNYGWLAVRKNGDVWGKAWGFDGKIASFGPIRARSITRGRTCHLVDREGTLHRLYGAKDYKSPVDGWDSDAVTVSTLDRAVGFFHEKGQSLMIALDSGGAMIGQLGVVPPKYSPPPADFFQGAVQIASGPHFFYVFEPGRPLRTWNTETGSPYPLKEIPDGVVQMDLGKWESIIVLQADGTVTSIGADGTINPIEVTPRAAQPAIRVRIGGSLCGAQKPDGTWIAWAGSVNELNDVVPTLGPLIDLEVAGFRFNTGEYASKPLTGQFLVYIVPKSGPSAPAPTALGLSGPTPKTTAPTSAATTKAGPVPPTAPAVTTPTKPENSSPALAANAALDIAAIPDLKALLESYLDARRTQVGDLATKYLRGLDSRLNQAADAGDLALVKAFRDEKGRVEALQKTLTTPATDLAASVSKPATLAELSEDTPDGVSNLRTTWTAEREKIRADLDGKLETTLKTLEADLTRARDFENAEAVLAYRESLGTAAPAVAAVEPRPANPQPAASPDLARATKDAPFENSLGMKFVPVKGTDVLFCIHETRWRDYEEYAKRADNVATNWKNQTHEGFTIKDDLEEHPVGDVSWEDAQAFCAWLSEKEGKTYRLPTDREWSQAVGIGDQEDWKADTTPETVFKPQDHFPWGKEWPPPKGAGNYSDQSRKEKARNATAQYLEDYDDGYPTTAPVMSFEANQLGLFDLGGNVWEWCEDWMNSSHEHRVLRGGSWVNYGRGDLLSSYRGRGTPTRRYRTDGFRVVLAHSSPSQNSPRPPADPSVVLPTLKLPQWLEKAAEKGGKLRIWGTFDGKPIDEKEVLKDFRERDYIKVSTGQHALVLGIQRRGNGKSILLNTSVPGSKLREYKKVNAVDRSQGALLANDQYYYSGGQTSSGLDLGENAIVAGGTNGKLIRLATGEWVARGTHWSPPPIQDVLRQVCTELTRDKANLVAVQTTGRVMWISGENRLRNVSVTSNPGSYIENPVVSQPGETIIDLLPGGSTLGSWVARGASGAVYAEKLGGFETPIAELSPARKLRSTASGLGALLAAQHPDGTWHAIGRYPELNEFIARIGPALDLDIYVYGDKDKHRVVLWIEPDTNLKP